VAFRKIIKQTTCAAALSFAVAACATVPTDVPAAKVPAPPVAEKVTFSDTGIAELEATMGAYIADRRLYGIHTRLVQDGETISDYKAGLRGLMTQKPIEDDTIYRIYSMTKPITGVAMMMLWEEGKFKLDDPVTKYVPEFENLKVLGGVNEDGSAILVDLERPPTMQEVMSHTAGFAYGLGGTDPANQAFRDEKIMRSPDMQTFINKVANVPLLFQPGEHWSYSASVDIQGHIVEKLSGQTFGEFLDERLFTPLGMTDTGFYVPEDDYDRFSEVYGFNPENGMLVPVPFPNVRFKKETVAFESGGGGLVSTMDDYGQFAQMLVNQGSLNGTQFIKPETLELMTTNVLTGDQNLSSLGINAGETYPGLGFGLNFGTIEDAAAVPTNIPNGSFFWGGAASTWFWIDPVNDLYFIGMVQIFETGNPGEELELRETSGTLVYKALED
jgi:CubicO group peptidase (beta-lactamase class C family)